MAPKKTGAKTETAPKGRPSKAKVVKEKPKLKTPSIVKVKLPIKNLVKTTTLNSDSLNNTLLTKKSKNLTSNDKLELANKVARAQLNKTDPVRFPSEPEPPPPQKQTNVVKKRAGRKKKAEEENNGDVDDSSMNVGSDSEEVSVQPTTPPKPAKRKYVRKAPVNPVKRVPSNPVKKMASKPLKRKLVTPINEISPSKKSKRKWTQSRITDMKIIVRRDSKVSLNGEEARTVSIAKPNEARKRGPRGKKTVEKDSSVLGSPSILSHPVPEISQEKLNIKQEVDEADKSANPVESRKTSVHSELSWTKDISNSSHTTCVTAVTSSDVVLIDNKLPKLSLHKVLSCPNNSSSASVEKEFTPRTPSDSSSSSSSSDSDSSDSESSGSKCNSFREIDVVDRHSLNLSTSSESHRSAILQKNIRNNSMNSTVNKIDRALEKLALSMKKIDMEMINWVGYQNEDININNKKLRDKILQNLPEESNIILQCQHVKNLLTDNAEEVTKETSVAKNTEVKNNEVNFVKPTDVVLPKTLNKSSEYSNLEKASHSRDETVYCDSKFDVNKSVNCFATDNIAYVPFDQSIDDDALSLYAESIGFESHRNSISSPPHNPPEFEEYIPQPVKNLPANKIVYNPTKISSNNQIPVPQKSPETVQNVRPIATVCEKQNADSTSVVRETNQVMNRIEGIEKLPVPINSLSNVQKQKGPCLLASVFKPMPGGKSMVFNGMCFFNLIGGCKNKGSCRFPHIEPPRMEICEKLAKLSECSFIHEYMIMKGWPGLRRKYGVCLINECKRRDLTRLLFEMAIDFITKANPNSQEDATLKVYVLEETLLHLNNVDLQSYEDLLLFGLQGKHLCDFFMEAIANTQNFSRFKPVFLKLSQFVIDKQKVFSLDVATHILERVAILPFEDSLAWGLIGIIEKTDAVIFENAMMAQFEKQLSGRTMLGAFLAVKKKASLKQPVLSPPFNPAVPPPVIRPDVDRLTSPLYPDRVQRYTSPDTTHLDSMNKPPEEPIITRTIHFNNFPNKSSSSSESTEDYRPRTPKPNSIFKSWREKSIFNKLARFPNKRTMDRQVTYGGSPSPMKSQLLTDMFRAHPEAFLRANVTRDAYTKKSRAKLQVL